MEYAMSAVMAEMDKIEAAVEAGDLELANDAVQKLRPMLVGRGTQDLLSLRERMQQISLSVVQQRDQRGQALRLLAKGRGGADTYQRMQQGASAH